MKKSGKNKPPIVGILTVSALTVLHFIVLIYLKYDLNNISLREFRFEYIGNVINCALLASALLGFLLSAFAKNSIDQKRVLFAITLQIISVGLLVLILFSSKVNILQSEKLLFNYPLKKVLTGSIFVSSYILQIYICLYFYGFIIGKDTILELRTLIRSGIALILLFVFTLIFVWNVKSFSQERIEKQKHIYGCIPGAAVYSRGKPSPIFEARIRKTLELYRNGNIKKIILTGGNAPGEITESEAARKYLVNLGVDKKNILIEKQTSTTTEQLHFLKDNFTNSQSDSLVIISDGFHLSRITQIAKFYKVKSIGVSSGYSLSFEKTLFYRTRESIALIFFWLFAI